MYIVNSYILAVILCFITMICWGSWGNTQKLAAKSWRYELFYWDYVIGMVLFALVLGFTLGSSGEEGRPFLADLAQGNQASFLCVLLGGAIFNAGNILLSASVSMAGMTVAFPLGVGIALVLGVIVNYLGTPSGDWRLLALGVLCVVCAIVVNAVASARMSKGREQASSSRKGILVAILAGILMSLFYRFVVMGMDVQNFPSPAEGRFTPYAAIFVFSVGVLISNFLFNTLAMRFPFVGEPVGYDVYFRGSLSTHATGVLGGCIWCLGTGLSYIASGQAGPAISYALGQGAPMVAALWGIFVWKEFRGASRPVNCLLLTMFVAFITGLALIILAGL
ncbi:MAG: multidrug DMT transporter permease [Bacteroidaceae bacterium]|nr:multidrug DMT transporter permease [Bacteroidaceae bacterium]